MEFAWGRRLVAGSAVLLLAAGGAVATASPGAAAVAAGQVFVVQGIVGTPLAVEIDGRPVAAAARPKTVLGPLALVAGRHVVVLRAGTRTLTRASFTVQPGRSIDVVAQRAGDAARTPRVVVFRNDLAPVGAGKSRLVVAHAAIAPPADVRVDGAVLFRDVAPGESLGLLVPARTYTVDVVASGSDDAVLAPVRLAVRPGTLTRVFAVGNPADGTADAVVQVLPVRSEGAGVPSSVHTGDGGQAADAFVGEGTSTSWPFVGGALLALAGAGALRWRARPRAARR